MKPEGSLTHSQVPTTCPYPEPGWSNHNIQLHEDPSYYYPPIHAWVSQVVSFPQVSPPRLDIRLFSPRTCYMPCPSHPSHFITWTIFGEQYRSLSSPLSSFFLHPLVTLSLLGPNILLNTLFWNTLSLCSSCNMSYQVSHPYKTTGKIIILYIFKFLDSKLEDKRFCTEW